MSIKEDEQTKNLPLVMIAGPTASGKSALGMILASALDGEIVNADSMQIYRDLPILTAIPSAEDQAKITHHGYAVLDAAERCSVGRWLDMTRDLVADIHHRGKVPILIGGTGMYLRAALEGISPIPEVDPIYREQATRQYEEQGGAAFRQALAAYDADLAARLHDGDRQRLIRGMEVALATGKPLSQLQALPLEGRIHGAWTSIVIEPPRPELYDCINSRYPSMVEYGGLDEAKALLSRDLDLSLPLMKSVGLPPVFAYLTGEMDYDASILLGCQDTRRYAKRQMTWFNNQLKANFIEDSSYNKQFSESFIEKILPKVSFMV
jgi:tRNA dimethylallyltransferase